MRAVIKTPDQDTAARFVTDRVEPALQPGEVRVEVAAASVCGSDAAFYAYGGAGSDLAMSWTPRTMGHEVGGVVAEVGPATSGLTSWAPARRD